MALTPSVNAPLKVCQSGFSKYQLVVELGQEIIITQGKKKLFPVENKFRSCQVVCKAKFLPLLLLLFPTIPYWHLSHDIASLGPPMNQQPTSAPWWMNG
jgi:hypothetical protein